MFLLKYPIFQWTSYLRIVDYQLYSIKIQRDCSKSIDQGPPSITPRYRLMRFHEIQKLRQQVGRYLSTTSSIRTFFKEYRPSTKAYACVIAISISIMSTYHYIYFLSLSLLRLSLRIINKLSPLINLLVNYNCYSIIVVVVMYFLRMMTLICFVVIKIYYCTYSPPKVDRFR